MPTIFVAGHDSFTDSEQIERTMLEYCNTEHPAENILVRENSHGVAAISVEIARKHRWCTAGVEYQWGNKARRNAQRPPKFGADKNAILLKRFAPDVCIVFLAQADEVETEKINSLLYAMRKYAANAQGRRIVVIGLECGRG